MAVSQLRPASIGVLALALLLAGCLTGAGRGAPVSAAVPSVAAAPTGPAPVGRARGTSSLVLEPAIEPDISDNFNPFSTGAPLYALGAPSFVYEPLVEYDELQVNQYYPWLAQSWSFSTSGQTITFQLRPKVTWDDGSTFSAADVAYTFNLLKEYPSINDGIPIVSAVATNPTTFTLTLSKPGYSYLYDIARVPIVKDGFAQGHSPADYVVKDPDGTGPYVLAHPSDITRHQAVLTARARYWQAGSPSIDRLVFPAYKDAAAAVSALATGRLDWAGNFIPDVKTAFLQKSNVFNHFWAPAVDCVALSVNLSRYPLDDLGVRQALSLAIDRDSLSQTATDGFDPPATSSSALVTPMDNQYLSTTDKDDLDDRAQAALSQKLMNLNGFHRDGDGFWQDKSGRPVSFSVEAQAGALSATIASVLVAQLRKAGFDVSTVTVPLERWAKDMADDDYDTAITTGASGPTPFYMYLAWLSPLTSALSGPQPVPAALKADGAKVSAALAQYDDNPSDSSAAQAAVESLASLVSAQLPVVPLMYGLAWGEFTTRHASGWPNGSNPYEPASPTAPFAEYTVLQLTPTGH